MMNLQLPPHYCKTDVMRSVLVHADCFDVFPYISDKSVNLILCDLPYGTTANKWDSLLDLNMLWKEYERILAPKGNIVLFGAGLFAFKLALSNEKLFRYDMVWKKSKCGSPLTAKYMPMKKHEMVLVFGKSASYYKPQLIEGTPYKRKWTPNKVNNMEYGIAGVQTDNKGTRHPTTILDFAQQWRRQDQLHPTQKPIKLYDFCFQFAKVEVGAKILDTHLGSGSSRISANKNGLNFVGFEIDSDYYEAQEKRYKNFISQTRLF